jgi:hypothetical protein
MRSGFLLLIGLTGCITHWQPQAGSPALVVNRSSATQFRVTRRDGSRVNVERPRIEGDSLIGSFEPAEPWPDMPGRIAIPLSDIQSIAEREADLPANVAVGTLVTLTIILFLIRGIGQ